MDILLRYGSSNSVNGGGGGRGAVVQIELAAITKRRLRSLGMSFEKKGLSELR